MYIRWEIMEVMNSNSQKHILIVDDDEETRTLLKRILGTWKPDYRVITASSGFIAMDRLMQQRFDLIVTDWHMKDMDGLELAEIVHSMLPDMRILLMSGSSTSDLDSEAKSLLTGWIEKPFTPTNVLSMIEKIIMN